MTNAHAKLKWSGLLRFQPIDFLLLAVPLAFLIATIPSWQNETALFFVSGLAIIPVTRWMSQATESISEHTGPGIGGLINATFGNGPELIFALMALSKGLIDVVKASIIGSILGNILVVLGISIVSGGVRFNHMQFNQTGIRVAATSLTLATIGLIFPTLFHASLGHPSGKWSLPAEQNLSVAIALVLLATYFFWLLFSLITHSSLFSGKTSEDDEEEKRVWPVSLALLVLGISAILIAFLSDFLAGSVEPVCRNLGLTQVFVSLIIVAIIGNIAEATAVLVALKNKMDLCLSITIGSSLQTALFVTPLLVLASHVYAHPMTLVFSIPEVASLAVAVAIVVLISGDGECNWVEGAQLLSVYLIIAILFYFLPEPAPEGSPPGGQVEKMETPSP